MAYGGKSSFVKQDNASLIWLTQRDMCLQHQELGAYLNELWHLYFLVETEIGLKDTEFEKELKEIDDAILQADRDYKDVFECEGLQPGEKEFRRQLRQVTRLLFRLIGDAELHTGSWIKESEAA